MEEPHDDDYEYKRQKRACELGLESLVLPKADSASEAGRLISQLPKLWSGANLEERRKLLLTILDAIYVDSKENMIVAIKPKAPFKPVFEVATTSEGSEVVLIHDPEAEPQIAHQPPPDGHGWRLIRVHGGGGGGSSSTYLKVPEASARAQLPGGGVLSRWRRGT